MPKRSRDKLPASFDVRVTRALATPLADSVVIALDHVAMAKSPRTNYRFTLSATGDVYYVQRSTKSSDWQIPFDQPFPDKPARKVGTSTVDGLISKLAAEGFFDHPGYEANLQAEGGDFWLVRARKGADVHAVVYQNVQPAFLEDLTAISDPLWKEPN